MASFEYINRSGVVIADTSAIQDEVNAEFRQVFGDDFIVDPATPQGSLVAAEITSRQSVARNNASLANQFNPAQSEGTFLDAVYALFGGSRNAQTRSTVTCTCTGVANVVIPAGSRASDLLGQGWRTTTTATISGAGSVDIVFESEDFGDIAASANTITQIVDNSVLGWETVNNAAAAVQGISTQNDSRTRQARKDQLAIQSRSTPEAVTARLSAVSGYGSHQFRENVTNASAVIDGIALVPHSIWVAVSGGSDASIAEALSQSKSDGANWNGSTSIAVMDPFSGQSSNVLFQRPTAVPLAIRVTIRASTGADVSAEVRQAVLDYAAGNVTGERGFVVGVDATPFEVGAAVNFQVSGVFVRTVEMSENPSSPTFGTGAIDIELDEIPTIIEANITVVLL